MISTRSATASLKSSQGVAWPGLSPSHGSLPPPQRPLSRARSVQFHPGQGPLWWYTGRPGGGERPGRKAAPYVTQRANAAFEAGDRGPLSPELACPARTPLLSAPGRRARRWQGTPLVGAVRVAWVAPGRAAGRAGPLWGARPAAPWPGARTLGPGRCRWARYICQNGPGKGPPVVEQDMRTARLIEVVRAVRAGES